VACPYFHPIRELLPALEPMPLPLGDAWRGICRAPGVEPFEPDQAALVPFCHLGYARGRCAHFPASDDAADAIRFAVDREAGAEIHLHYVCERNHHPFSLGKLCYSLSVGQFREEAAENLLRQAEAYIASYLRRSKEAFAASRASDKQK
jgi:hypothetical protein